MSRSAAWRRGFLAALVSAAAVLVAATEVGAQQTVTVRAVPRVASVPPGTEFDVDAVVETSGQLRGGQIGLKFDPALIEVLGVEQGPYLKDFAAGQGGETLMMPQEAVIDNAAGTVQATGVAVMGMTVIGGAPGPGVLLTFHVRAKDGASGPATLTLTDAVFADHEAMEIDAAAVTVVDGQVAIDPSAAAVAPAEAPTFAVPPTAAGGEATAVAQAPGAIATLTLPPGAAGQQATAVPADGGSGGASPSTEMLLLLAGGVVVLAVVAFVVMRNR